MGRRSRHSKGDGRRLAADQFAKVSETVADGLRDEIRQLFIAAGADPEKPFVATCGSGVTANALIFAARLLGNRDTRLYDGSWSEWGADPATPKAEGPA